MTTIDTNAISIPEIKASILEYIQNKPESDRWKDFYESSTGTMLVELLAAMGGYISYQNLIARRESYLWDAKIRSSNVAIAESKGYPVYRGKNEHFVLTMTPTESAVLEKYSVIGTCLDKDIVTLEPLNLIYDEQISFEVVVGDLKETSKTINTSDPHNFRFDISGISEDFLLFLDEVEVPVSTRILDLLNDYYCVLTNSLGSLDVLYLNRTPPESWVSNSLYSNGQYISPDFTWRDETTYAVGQHCTPSDDNGLYYQATVGGETSDTEPTWPTTIDETVTDGEVTWRCMGALPERLYFKSTSVGTAYSGSNEPLWPIELGAVVEDNEVIWQCVRDYTYSLYTYEPGSVLMVKYIELAEVTYTEADIDLYYGNLISTTLENSYSSPEDIDDIKINASLYHETERVIKGRHDYKKIFRELLPNSVGTNGHDVSPAIVELSYVKDHTTRLWAIKSYVEAGTEIMPSSPNNFIYQATNSGYTAVDTNGISGVIEPTWPTTIGETVDDGQIRWKCAGEGTGDAVWETMTTYNINASIEPTTANGYYYMPQEFLVEPSWPIAIDAEVTDNEIVWRCIDTVFLKGYEASTWEVDTEVITGEFVIPIVSQNFFYQAQNSGITGPTEPTWPKVLGETVEDNGIVWECYDLMDAEKYQKNIALEKLSSYRVFGVEPPTIVDPKIVHVFLNISLTVSDDSVLLATAKADIDAILEESERSLYSELDVDDIEYAIERLSYVKIARVVLVSETKSETWESYRLYRLRDVVRPTIENGFYYESYYNRSAEEEGYSQGDQYAYSQGSEPVWPTTLGETVEGGNGHIVWTCVEIPVDPVNEWARNNLYSLDAIVVPSEATGFAYQITSIQNLEPTWPTTVGESVVDGAVYWVCRDPNQSPPKCDWNEYYIIGRKVTLS